MNLLHKKILFCVTGGIAAYKAPEILHRWIKAGCDVETILTEAAEEFVSPLVLSTLSKKRVWRERDFLCAEYGWQIPHISLTEWADLVVVAPAAANALRIAAVGDSSTLFGATLVANTKQLLIFPAMNENMLQNPAVQSHIRELRERGAIVVDPDFGLLACSSSGKGRLPSYNVIDDYVEMALSPKKDFTGKKVLVTAGPTHEYIDPVRFISNPSSGKMGYAIAKQAWNRGAAVTLVSGPVSLRKPTGIEVVNVTSADEMYDACLSRAAGFDVIVKAAAVGDYRPAHAEKQKIKRGHDEKFVLDLVQNRDIAAALGSVKSEKQILIGFAAETQNVQQNALKKLAEKNLDVIVSNDVLADGAGFGVDTNKITVTTRNGKTYHFNGTKNAAADAILNVATELIVR
ncbi:MAG: bifunctional phosphopantothenoylcysteine decarboxylase/phosphopantothenate--cysteine ligase CoaBC [Synergistes sp.]|nr:bifunctional phosphopantothenoylcysteine decarboxylase/phosphopantothenate--cysteine ligase CoaBC [Synergistes sp.]